eukprot:TRINITY_DN77406_c0_g1_i1.p1 TRINITY_DN77406_c0_g1~~TRINITY_DN77406_c0_g1_i1.p1  ORF type:complete len:409 (-),score=68.66 TRINITY_DN77406_c0_g1_i1:69-1274(-)
MATSQCVGGWIQKLLCFFLGAGSMFFLQSKQSQSASGIVSPVLQKETATLSQQQVDDGCQVVCLGGAELSVDGQSGLGSTEGSAPAPTGANVQPKTPGLSKTVEVDMATVKWAASEFPIDESDAAERWVKVEDPPEEPAVPYKYPAPSPWECQASEAPIFVINVKGERGRKRREHAKQQLEKEGVTNYFFFPAADAKLHENSWCENERTRFPRANKLSPDWYRHNNGCKDNPQLANTLSHRMVYELVVKHNLPCAIIFEDDFALCPQFKGHLRNVTHRLPPFDFIQLGFCFAGGKRQSEGVCPHRHGIDPVLKYGWQGPCAHGYIISLQGAKFFATVNSPARVAADGAFDPRYMERHPGARNNINWKGKNPSLPGAYWGINPIIVYQGYDIAEGGAENDQR